jgi:hypothetical protein
MLRYWASVALEANKTTWNWLFGSLRHVALQSVLFVLATAALFYLGKSQQMTDQVSWLQAVLIASAIVYVPMFLLHFFRVPYLRDRESSKKLID